MHQNIQILLVDDDSLLLKSFESYLSRFFKVFTAESPDKAAELLSSNKIQMVLLDLNLGKSSGQDLIEPWRKTYPDLEIVVLTGQNEIRSAIACIKKGAADYLVKPMEPEQVLLSLHRVLENQKLRQSLEKLEPLIRPVPAPFVGAAPILNEIMKKVSVLKNKTHLNILILGESGTGKEILARFLHQQEGDSQRPFIVANMPAIPFNLMEAELFGAEKGAYTDAKVSRAGKFELADSGDIFLDEIGDLPFEMQSKILRVLQEKQIQRVGSNRLLKLNFRTIAATNQALPQLIESGKFREDLLYRLSDVVLTLPPLRERKSDIPLLIEHFIRKHSLNSSTPQIDPSLLEKMVNYDWPGNIRQLESCIKRALIFSDGNVVKEVDIYEFRTVHTESGNSLKDFDSQVREFEKKLLSETLKRNGGNRSQTLDQLRLTKATFYRKLQEFGLSNHDSRR